MRAKWGPELCAARSLPTAAMPMLMPQTHHKQRLKPEIERERSRLEGLLTAPAFQFHCRISAATHTQPPACISAPSFGAFYGFEQAGIEAGCSIPSLYGMSMRFAAHVKLTLAKVQHKFKCFKVLVFRREPLRVAVQNVNRSFHLCR